MADVSRDSFKQTQNLLNDLRQRVATPQTAPRHYVSIRLQQGVPLTDADWNEQEDIRRLELETLLTQAIGSGVPAGSDGFRIVAAGVPSDFLIGPGSLFVDGWLVHNGNRVSYSNQPHANSSGLAPPLPVPLPPAPLQRRDLVYLDAWERQVLSQEDENLVDVRIGLETCFRIERVWVVRMEPIGEGADPLDPATIPNREPYHRYYPLATVDRRAGSQLEESMFTDQRRTHLTLEAQTHAPLLVYDPVLDQQLNSARLALVFQSNLAVLGDLLVRAPGTFVFAGNEIETWQAMTAFQDVRATAIPYEQQSDRQALHRHAAFQAMRSFFDVQIRLVDTLQAIVDVGGIAGQDTEDLLATYQTHLEGGGPADSTTVSFAIAAGDLLGAAMAQERLNQALAMGSDVLPEGTLTASLISVAPTGALQDNTIQPQYALTVRIQSNLTSAQGAELIRVIASAGFGWHLEFADSTEVDPRQFVISVPNGMMTEVVLTLSADPGAANTQLRLTVRPERRQQLVYQHPPAAMELGQELLLDELIGTLDYQGPSLQPGQIAQVPRAVMAGGVPIGFGVTNVSNQTEQFQLTVTPQGPATGWQPPNEPTVVPLAPNENRAVNLNFQITDQAGAVSPLTYRMQLVRVTGGINEPQSAPSSMFDLTFELT